MGLGPSTFTKIHTSALALLPLRGKATSRAKDRSERLKHTRSLRSIRCHPIKISLRFITYGLDLEAISTTSCASTDDLLIVPAKMNLGLSNACGRAGINVQAGCSLNSPRLRDR